MQAYSEGESAMSFISVRGSGGPNSVAVKENAPKLRPLLFRKSSIEFDRFRNCATLSKATQAEKEVPTGPHMRTRSTRPTPYNPVSRGPGLRCTVYSQHQAPSIPGLRCTSTRHPQSHSLVALVARCLVTAGKVIINLYF